MWISQGVSHLDFGAGAADAGHDGGVVQGVADHQAALADERGHYHAVCGKAHAKGDSVLLPQEVSHHLFQLDMWQCQP